LSTIEPSTLIDALSWRYAVKQFDAARKIPESLWSTIERAIVLSPSSYGLQPWKFIVVSDPALRVTLRAASWKQSQITDASHIVVFCRRREVKPADVQRFVDRTLAVRGGDPAAVAPYRDMMLNSIANPATLPGGNMDSYTRSQTYIALGFFLASCALLGVDACPMEGFDAAAYDRTLGLEGTDFAATVVGAAGYRASTDWLAGLKKVRFEMSDLIERR